MLGRDHGSENHIPVYMFAYFMPDIPNNLAKQFTETDLYSQVERSTQEQSTPSIQSSTLKAGVHLKPVFPPLILV